MKPTNQEAARLLGNLVFNNNSSKMVAKTKKGLREKP